MRRRGTKKSPWKNGEALRWNGSNLIGISVIVLIGGRELLRVSGSGKGNTNRREAAPARDKKDKNLPRVDLVSRSYGGSGPHC